MDHGLQEDLTRDKPMDTSQFTSNVRKISLSSITTNPQNPRGQFDTTKDPSFERLASSVKQMGVLVPIVVRRKAGHDGQAQYELVDGERRYCAAKAVGLRLVPAHVLSTDVSPAELRKVMFHLHMTREQWEPWAQCIALGEIYPELQRGIPVSQKDQWAQKIRAETNTSAATARDRVRVLSWPKALKDEIENFLKLHPNHDIYSYVLAIEASIIEPSLQSFPEFYASPRTARVNEVRGGLLKKTLEGIATGSINSREVIRSVDTLFTPQLTDKSRRVASGIFKSLVTETNYMFEDARAEIAAKLPGAFAEKPPKLRRLIAQVESLAGILKDYRPEYIEHSAKLPGKRKEHKKNLSRALRDLEGAISSVLSILEDI